MSELISRQEAIDAVHSTIFDFFDTDEDDSDSPMTESDKRLLKLNKAVTTAIRRLPSVDHVKHGEWLKIEDCNIAQCSECFDDFDYIDGLCYLCHGQELPNYCPNCGAKMERRNT